MKKLYFIWQLTLGFYFWVALPAAAQNLALNKTATATSFQGGFPKQQAFDGDTNTRWGSEYDPNLTTIPPDSNSIYVDLQGRASITQIYLFWETALGKDFKLEVSDDAVSWRILKKITGNTQAMNTIPVTGTGRYVRMHGLKRGTGYGYSLWEFQVSGTLSPLPVTLTAFSAACQGQVVALHWATATEHNNNNFAVQRSVDGVQFTTVAVVLGTGDSQTAKNYVFTDEQPARGAVSYYRLMQVDADGATTYSPVRSVHLAASYSVSAFPNPTSAHVAVEWEADAAGAGHWWLTTTMGQVLDIKELVEQNGHNTLIINLQPYAAGSYILTLENAEKLRHCLRLQKSN